jgi:signal transduction histidine kinase
VVAQDYISVVDSLNGRYRDSLAYALTRAQDDTTRALLTGALANHYKFDRPDSTFKYGYLSLALSRDIGLAQTEILALHHLELAYTTLGNTSKALQLNLEAHQLSDKNNLRTEKGLLLLTSGESYRQSSALDKALSAHREAMHLFDSLLIVEFSAVARSNMGLDYLMLNQPDSALFYAERACADAQELNEFWVLSLTNSTLGSIYAQLGRTELALSSFRQAIPTATTSRYLFYPYYSIAELYRDLANVDSSVYYANESIKIAERSSSYNNLIKVHKLLAGLYENVNIGQALLHSRLALAYKDSLTAIVNTSMTESLVDFDDRERQRELEVAKQEYQSNLRRNAFLGSTFTLVTIVALLYFNNRQKQKSKQKIEKAYSQLQSTQSQLIQSEKMASLGELTAGIAHEIQNPLNFVNNFSEVNDELTDELEEEARKGNLEGVLVIAKDIKANQQKISHHGKRADGIVKGMLQHSRRGNGVKELVDINTLADEYLRLAYHGLRARDPSFNATMKTDFDEGLEKVAVVPQDMGRVLLNLITNAFYAVSERKKTAPDDYEPAILLSTKREGDRVLIRVSDNGSGIPHEVINKIFQPFFTTKPTGQGTGLGLSLSYDIVKAHGGELTVLTEDGVGTEFIIQLPI